MNTLKTRRLLSTALSLVLVLPLSTIAGEILTDNGDTLEGEIDRITETHVVWLSSILGKISVPKKRIVDLVTAIPLKLPGEQSPCYWAGLAGNKAQLECDEAIVQTDFLSIKDAVRFEGYRATTHQYRGRMTATGNKESGRVNKEDWNMQANVFMRHGDMRHDLWLKYRAQSVNDAPLQQAIEASYQYDWFLSTNTFWTSKLAGQEDEPRLIDSRLSVGTGIGYQFWETKTSSLSIETGPEYLKEVLFTDFSQSSTIENGYTSWRLASGFRLQLPRDMRLYSNAEVLQSTSINEDWELDTRSGLSLPIASGISADITYDFDYDNTPPDGLASSDSKLRLGVGYQW